MQQNTVSETVTVAQAADLLGINVRAVQRRIASGVLPASKLDPTKVTSAYVIRREDVHRLAASASSTPLARAG